MDIAADDANDMYHFPVSSCFFERQFRFDQQQHRSNSPCIHHRHRWKPPNIYRCSRQRCGPSSHFRRQWTIPSGWQLSVQQPAERHHPLLVCCIILPAPVCLLNIFIVATFKTTSALTPQMPQATRTGSQFPLATHSRLHA